MGHAGSGEGGGLVDMVQILKDLTFKIIKLFYLIIVFFDKSCKIRFIFSI